MATLHWKSLASFEKELPGASDDHLRVMHTWAESNEQSADRPGMGRNPKERRLFRQMRQAAEAEAERRGQ